MRCFNNPECYPVPYGRVLMSYICLDPKHSSCSLYSPDIIFFQDSRFFPTSSSLCGQAFFTSFSALNSSCSQKQNVCRAFLNKLLGDLIIFWILSEAMTTSSGFAPSHRSHPDTSHIFQHGRFVAGSVSSKRIMNLPLYFFVYSEFTIIPLNSNGWRAIGIWREPHHKLPFMLAGEGLIRLFLFLEFCDKFRCKPLQFLFP